MEKTRDQKIRGGSKTQLIEQIKVCLHSGDYSRALDSLRGAAADFPDDAEFLEVEKLAQDGAKRNAEANRLITESQELFAQRKSAEAIQLLREAYELDKNNSLARAILANALVEHANSLVENEWWEAENLARQALGLNPVHPTAKTIYGLIIERKKVSSVEEWVARADKLQSSGDLFAALAWVAEGLAVHPNDPKLLQIQEAIQREQGAKRRQTRRSDLQNLRRMEAEIDKAADAAAKRALGDQIQGLAAKYWTDGEILAIANGLLQRLGLVTQDSPAASAHGKNVPVIFYVPRPSASRAAPSEPPESPAVPRRAPPKPMPQRSEDNRTVRPKQVPARVVPPQVVSPQVVPQEKVAPTPPQPQLPIPLPVSVAPVSTPAAKVPRSSKRKQATESKVGAWSIVPVCVIILVAAIFFGARKHPAAPIAKAPAAAPGTSAPVPAPAEQLPTAPAVAAPPETTSERSVSTPLDATAETVPPDNQPTTESAPKLGTLIVVAGQDDARVSLNGKLQPQLTRGGQLRLPNLAPKDYAVQVSKAGFQDPPPQTIRIHKGDEARLMFNLQPQPRLAALTIQGGVPGTTVLVDQTTVGTIQPDGTLSVSTVNPGDHVVELRKERAKPRQLKKHFVAGGTITLAAADAALDAAPGELKITFSPADAKVAIAKGDFLKLVSSGVPLSVAPGTYTLTARTAERFTRSSTLEVVAGQSKTLDLSLGPSGMSKWQDPGAWKQERDTFIRRGGDFVLYGVAPTSGTFVFSAMLTKGHLMQWVLNYADARNYVLFQMDDKNFYRSVIHNGEKTDQIIVPHKGDKKSFRTLQIHVSPTEIVHQVKDGDGWTILDRWMQPGANLSLGKFGFYIPGGDEVAVSSFAHYADLNIR